MILQFSLGAIQQERTKSCAPHYCSWERPNNLRNHIELLESERDFERIQLERKKAGHFLKKQYWMEISEQVDSGRSWLFHWGFFVARHGLRELRGDKMRAKVEWEIKNIIDKMLNFVHIIFVHPFYLHKIHVDVLLRGQLSGSLLLFFYLLMRPNWIKGALLLLQYSLK